MRKTIKRALISVSDKTGLLELAEFLYQRNVEILSTGGTAKQLQQAGIQVTEVSDYTGFPEMMDGRIKTLHPKIHGGLLGRPDTDAKVMAEHAIGAIELVIVNLYPFEKVTQKDKVDFDEIIENIDIGGPAMLRSAAKNHQHLTVVCDPQDYQNLLAELSENQGRISFETRFQLAAKVFKHTADYDKLIADYLTKKVSASQQSQPSFPKSLNLQFDKAEDLRYGENPHQKAALYLEKNFPEASVAHARQLQGKALSYNNIADADAALQCVKTFNLPACVIVKHANPCGVAIANSLSEAYLKAFQCDPVSAFGGIIAFNRPLDKTTAKVIIEQQFVEVVIAPEVADEARQILAAKANIRVLACGFDRTEAKQPFDLKKIDGGLLLQDKDTADTDENALRIVTKRKPTDKEMQAMRFAWKVAKFVKSNAVVYARDLMTVGIGAGQMSRVFSAEIALAKAKAAKLEIEGAVMASDAFFPFRDGIDAAAKAGISAIIQPGGSIKDKEVIAAANEHDIAMVLTGIRHFRH